MGQRTLDSGTPKLVHLTISVSSAGAERSFNKLKQLPNYLRSTMVLETGKASQIMSNNLLVLLFLQI